MIHLPARRAGAVRRLVTTAEAPVLIFDYNFSSSNNSNSNSNNANSNPNGSISSSSVVSPLVYHHVITHPEPCASDPAALSKQQSHSASSTPFSAQNHDVEINNLKQIIEVLHEEKIEMTKVIKTLKDGIIKEQSNNSSLALSSSELSTQLNRLNLQLSNIKISEKQLMLDWSASQKKLQQSQEMVEQQNNDIKRLTQELDALKSENVKLQQNQQTTQESNQHGEIIEKLQKENHKLLHEIDTMKRSHEFTLRENMNRMDDKDRMILEQNDDIDILNDDVSSLKAAQEAHAAQQQQAAQRISELETDEQAHAQEIDTLKKQVDEQALEIEALSKANNELLLQIESLKQQNETQQQTLLKDQEQKYNELSSKYDELNNQYTDEQNKYSDLSNEYNSLQSKYDTLTPALSQLEETITQLTLTHTEQHSADEIRIRHLELNCDQLSHELKQSYEKIKEYEKKYLESIPIHESQQLELKLQHQAHLSALQLQLANLTLELEHAQSELQEKNQQIALLEKDLLHLKSDSHILMSPQLLELKNLLSNAQQELNRLKSVTDSRDFLITKAQMKLKTLKPYLGLDIATGPSSGVKVTALQLNGPASMAGLLKGDILESLNQQTVRTGLDFRTAVQKIKPGDEVVCSVLRGKCSYTYNIEVSTKSLPFSSIQILRRISAGIVRAGDQEFIADLDCKDLPSRSPDDLEALSRYTLHSAAFTPLFHQEPSNTSSTHTSPQKPPPPPPPQQQQQQSPHTRTVHDQLDTQVNITHEQGLLLPHELHNGMQINHAQTQ